MQTNVNTVVCDAQETDWLDLSYTERKYIQTEKPRKKMKTVFKILNQKLFVDIARKDRLNFSIRQINLLKIIKFVRFLHITLLAQRLTIYIYA